MDPLSLLLRILIVLWLGAVAVGIVRAWFARTPRLIPISPQAHDRFSNAWERIAAEFVHSPSRATREAEDLVYSLLAARGQPTSDDRLPDSMYEARRWLARERQDGTEALRQAMVHYKVVFLRVIGSRPADESAQSGRRTMA